MKKITVKGAAAVLLAAAVLFSSCGKSSRANKMEPKDYYSYIENKSIDEGLKSAGKSIALEDGFTTDFSLELSLLKEGKNLAKTLLSLSESGVSNLDWLDSASLNGKIAVKDAAMAANLTAGVNKARLSLDAAMNEDSLCIRSAELNKKYLSLPSSFMSGMSGLDVGKIIKSYAEYLAAVPSPQVLVAEIQKYKDSYLKYATDVSKTTSAVTKAGCSQEFTVLTVNFEGENAQNLIKEILTLVKNDEAVEKFVTAMGNFQDSVTPYGKGNTSWEKFQKKVDELLDDMEEYGLSDFSNIQMDVYVNSKDEISGRTFRLSGNDIASYLLTKDGKKFGFGIEVDSEGSSYGIQGSGKCSGSVYSGDYTILEGSEEIQKFTLEGFDASFAKKGILKGKLSITPQSAQLNTFKFDLDFNAGGSEQKYALSVLQDSKKLLSSVYSTKLYKASAIKLPSDAVAIESEKEIQDYVKALKFDNLNAIIKKIGLPKEFEDTLTSNVTMMAKSFTE